VGPSNIALVQFYKIDQAYLAAVNALKLATAAVRIQQGKVNTLTTDLEAAHKRSIELEAKARELDADLKARDARIEVLRERQQNATNDREYKALILEITTQKADQKKAEEAALAGMDASEKQKALHAETKTRLENETAKLAQMNGAIDKQVAELTAEVEQLKGPRDEGWKTVPEKTKILYERAASRHEGESMAPIAKPKAKVEEYICTGCNMDLVVDIYNRLHSRDEPAFCPNCGRLLYIPEELPLEVAVKQAKPKSDKPKKPRAPKKPKDTTLAGATTSGAARVFDGSQTITPTPSQLGPDAEAIAQDAATPDSSADDSAVTEPAASSKSADPAPTT
jgi:uncharacterized protein